MAAVKRGAAAGAAAPAPRRGTAAAQGRLAGAAASSSSSASPSSLARSMTTSASSKSMVASEQSLMPSSSMTSTTSSSSLRGPMSPAAFPAKAVGVRSAPQRSVAASGPASRGRFRPRARAPPPGAAGGRRWSRRLTVVLGRSTLPQARRNGAAGLGPRTALPTKRVDAASGPGVFRCAFALIETCRGHGVRRRCRWARTCGVG
mmetsp:Transcript_37268/g.116532  ORF Transcript_37268/g.116532 Transcript_37268/m.116532 type:complete len:204 (-) Transcript_37268:50-661(-)